VGIAVLAALAACDGAVTGAVSDGCNVVAPLPAGGITSVDTSLTPRPHAAAELLAMEASGEFMAPPALYERVAADLEALTGSATSEAGNVHFGCGVVTEIIVAMTEAGVSQVESGEYTAWDDYNEALDLTERRALATGGYVLHFDGVYNHATLEQVYADLPEVRHVERNGVVGSGGDVCLQRLGDAQDTNLYVFASGSGDCQSGCIATTYSGYARNGSGAVEFLGSFDGGDAEPDWFAQARQCRSFLSL
jgi:hypothetical protein